MTDHSRRRSRRRDDTVVPLLTGALLVVALGPAVLAAAKQWFLSRSHAVSLSLGEWWDRNWWLAAFWAVELVVLLLYLWWFSRRKRRRRAQLDSVVANLSRILPADWNPSRHLKVLRWQGYRPMRLQLLLTPRSPITDRRWQRAVAQTLSQVLGRIEPLSWPTAAAGGVLDWGGRSPRLDIRVRTGAPVDQLPADVAEGELDEADPAGAGRPDRRSPQQS
jgi:hypothetical protein